MAVPDADHCDALSRSRIQTGMSGFAGLAVDLAVVRRARHGDARAHEIVFHTYAGAVHTLALRITGSPAAAHDLLQETFIEVMRSVGGYRGDASLGTWIRRIAVSKCLMHLRSAWEQRARGIDEAPPETRDRAEPGDGPAQLEQGMDLEAALGSLSPTARAVVWLHDVEGYTHREIGALLGRSESFSKSQLARAHASLRAALELAVPACDSARLGPAPSC